MTELKPCTKFLGNSVMDQWGHIKQEFYEVYNAIGDKEHLAEELVDLQTSCETLLTIIGADVDEVRRKVIVKNEARGYYREA